jgi:hypothetical protein
MKTEVEFQIGAAQYESGRENTSLNVMLDAFPENSLSFNIQHGLFCIRFQ